MPILTPEVASLCGALDSDAVQDGQPFGAHWLRPLVRSSNRTIGKQQLLASLTWPEVTGTEDGVYGFEGIAPIWWVRCCPPIHVDKRPGLTSVTVWIRMFVPTSQVVEIFVATNARPWSRFVAADLTHTGSAAFVDETITGIPVRSEGDEQIEIWVRGRVTGTLADVAYGSPNTNTDVFTIAQSLDVLAHANNTWNASGINSLAQGGHAINFYDADGVQIGGPRQIVAMVPNPTLLAGDVAIRFHPALAPLERHRLDELATFSAGGSFEIVEVPTYAITDIGAYAETRSP